MRQQGASTSSIHRLNVVQDAVAAACQHPDRESSVEDGRAMNVNVAKEIQPAALSPLPAYVLITTISLFESTLILLHDIVVVIICTVVVIAFFHSDFVILYCVTLTL